MYDPHPSDWHDPWAVAPRPPRGRPLIAWLVIIPVVMFLVLAPKFLPSDPEAPAEEMPQVMTRFQARTLVGSRGLTGMDGENPLDQPAVQALNSGDYGQRLRFVVLAGELAGPARALAELDELDDAAIDFLPDERRVRNALRRVYQDYHDGRFDAPSVRPRDRELLKRELGWFGELALTPARHPDPAARERVLAPARRTAVTVLTVFFVGALLGVGGFVGLIVFVVLALNGSVRSGMNLTPKEPAAGADPASSVDPSEPVLLSEVAPTSLGDELGDEPGNRLGDEPVLLADASSPPPSRVAGGGIYAETFAVWIVLYQLLQLLAAVTPTEDGLLLAFFAQMLSLSALAWPVLRGLSWRQTREDLGLTLGNPLKELIVAIGCYAMTLPMVLIGALLMLVLIRAGLGGEGVPFGNQGRMPAHPIVAEVLHADSWKLTQVFLLMVVGAPIMEEVFFRGALYRHLREATAGWRVGLSAFVSATIGSLIFAVIHPQGLVAVPMLMAVAYGLALAREWRGTLLTPMFMHALHNGAIFLLLTTVVAE